MIFFTFLQKTLEQELPAVNVFACAIKYLKDRLLDDINNMGFGSLESNEIIWVLAVPAVFDDTAKMFMREAAEKVSITKILVIKTYI